MSEKNARRRRAEAAATPIDLAKLIADRSGLQQHYDALIASLERMRADANAAKGAIQYLDRLIASAETGSGKS